MRESLVKERKVADDISVIEVAKSLGKRRQSIFKIINKLEIPTTLKKGASSRGQKIAYITSVDQEKIKEYVTARTRYIDKDHASPVDTAQGGNFYVMQLEPTLAPNRIKFGFTTNLTERLSSHKTAAPYVQVVKTWPCKLLWEKTAIDCIARECMQIRSEIFEAKDIHQLTDKLNLFFALMNE